MASLSGDGKLAPKFLFVPVSGAYGMGEYARSLAIALATKRRWPQADIRFVLSRQAPYASSAPFPSTLLASSPTFHSAAVIELIDSFRPDVAIFDNAGRTAQLRAASNAGARVVYISARARQRRRAFRLRWMRLIDEHWIAYPEFIAGSLNWLERLKLNRLKRPAVRYLDVILSQAAGEERDSILARIGCTADAFVLVVPGGGTGHPGAMNAMGQFLAAARSLADSDIATVFVGGSAASGGSSPARATPHLHCIDSLPQPELVELMRGARLIVANGGSTLLQAIACGRACVAIPIAHDQNARIQRCVNAAVAVSAALDSASIVQASQALLRDETARLALARRAKNLALADGIQVALAALTPLVEAK
jgi:hypothetical protein